jgi:hypothetical protein
VILNRKHPTEMMTKMVREGTELSFTKNKKLYSAGTRTTGKTNTK